MGDCSQCREVIWFLCVFFLLFLFLSVSHFFFSFDFLLMLSIYFGDCQALVWSHASGIFGVLVVRYFYWDEKKKKREYMWICVYTHTPMCVWGMLMGVQKQQWRLLHHTSTLFLGLCYVNVGEKKKTSRLKVLSLHKEVGDKKKSKWQGVLIVLSTLLRVH